MNAPTKLLKPLIATAFLTLLTAACSSVQTQPDGAVGPRTRLAALQADNELASRAPVAINEAAAAVRAAEVPERDSALSSHLVFIADRKVDTAIALAQSRLLVDQRKVLADQRDGMRLDARTREADRAHADAGRARAEADRARTETDRARTEADRARFETERSRAEAGAAQQQANAAQLDAELARQQADELQQQIRMLNARETDRGLVVTLGDVLFATGRAELSGGAANNLNRLAAFLNRYPDRTVTIEGHTDSVGRDDFNQVLSQRRAESVRNYLTAQGIAGSRLQATGAGERSPISSNDTATGRQQNRRVEVIIANSVR